MDMCRRCDKEARRKNLCWKHYRIECESLKPKKTCKLCGKTAERTGYCWQHYRQRENMQKKIDTLGKKKLL